MVELSGQDKDSASVDEQAPAPAPRGQRLWAVLLVLDSFFVIIFGGALAAKMYQHWQAPAQPTRRARPVKMPAPKPAEPAKSEAPKAEPAKPAEAPKSEAAKAEPAKPAAKAESAKADAPRPPKPSLLHEAPRRQTAGLAGQASKPAPAAAAPAGEAPVVKAQPVEFRYKGQARKVEVVGAFIVRGGRKAMVEAAPGEWTLTLYLTPNTYRYFFAVNGKKVLDPANSKTERGMSLMTVVPAAQP